MRSLCFQPSLTGLGCPSSLAAASIRSRGPQLPLEPLADTLSNDGSSLVVVSLVEFLTVLVSKVVREEMELVRLGRREEGRLGALTGAATWTKKTHNHTEKVRGRESKFSR